MRSLPLTGGIILLISICAGFERKAKKHEKPNIIYIMADDIGWNDVGFHNPKVNTPHIDSLAKKGVELTDYHTQPMCTPSRAALLTGKYPSNNGLQQYVMLENSKSCLPLEHKTVAQYMRELDYATKYVGKWHVGYCNDNCLPINRGFQEFRGIINGQADYFTWIEEEVLMRHVNGKVSNESYGEHLTLLDKKMVQEMISDHKGKTHPLFMIISPTAPHAPLQVTKEMYDAHDFLSSDEKNTRKRRKFLGLVSAVDDLVGATIQSLKDAKLYDNSVIVFTSDNGGASVTLLPPDDYMECYGNNYPLRMGKASFHEGGVRVPALYHDTRLHDGGEKRDFLMHITDWLPTFLELAGHDNPNGLGIDGISQLPNLGASYSPNGRYNVRSEMLVGLTEFVTGDSKCSLVDAAYRWGDWKLIYGRRTSLNMPAGTEWQLPIESPETKPIQGDSCMKVDEAGKTVARCLFNLADDLSETKDLYDEHSEIVQLLLDKIDAAKAVSVQSVWANPLGPIPETTNLMGEHLVPASNYCNPATDFPLKPVSHICYELPTGQCGGDSCKLVPPLPAK